MYDFHEFVEKIEDLSWHEMGPKIQSEIHHAERAAYSGKPGCVKHREMGAPQYASRLKALAFFHGNCMLPAGASPEDIAVYQRIAKKLVEKKQLKPEVLEVFEK